jgi:hypothetical protein
LLSFFFPFASSAFVPPPRERASRKARKAANGTRKKPESPRALPTLLLLGIYWSPSMARVLPLSVEVARYRCELFFFFLLLESPVFLVS